MYTVKELADLAGVTPRTLRYYDEEGLLSPAEIGANGYRYYDRESLLRLQQILFFRELDFPLKGISEILEQRDFRLLDALEDHQKAIQKKIQQYQTLLGTVQRTISSIQGVENMDDQEYFVGFDEKKYEGEAQERWGRTDQYKESQRKWSSYSQEKKEEIKQEGGEITLRMVTDDPAARADDPGVQQAVGDYHHYLNKYFYSCDVQFLRSLADMWVADERFAINYEHIREGGAAFVRDAVHMYCDRELEKGG